MYKRGQITIFIIVGILILALVGSYFVLRSDLIKEELKSESTGINTASIKIQVENCLKDTAEDGTIYLAEHGGYSEFTNLFGDYPVYSVPEYFEIYPKDNILNGMIVDKNKVGVGSQTADEIQDDVDLSENSNIEIKAEGFKNLFRKTPQYSVPYYFYLGNDTFPEKEVLESELANYIEGGLEYCLDFDTYKGFEITGNRYNVDVVINYDNIRLDLSYPLKVKKEGREALLEEYQTTVASELGRVYETVGEIINAQNIVPNQVPLGFITELGKENNFNYTTYHFADDVLFDLTFDVGNNQVLNYNFMVGYDWDMEEEILKEEEPIVEVTSEIVEENLKDYSNKMVVKNKETKFQLLLESDEIDYANLPRAEDYDIWEKLKNDPMDIDAVDLALLSPLEALNFIGSMKPSAMDNPTINSFLLDQMRGPDSALVIGMINDNPEMLEKFMVVNKINLDISSGELGGVESDIYGNILSITTGGDFPTVIPKDFLDYVDEFSKGRGKIPVLVLSTGEVAFSNVIYSGKGLMVDYDRVNERGNSDSLSLLFDGNREGKLTVDYGTEPVVGNLHIRTVGTLNPDQYTDQKDSVQIVYPSPVTVARDLYDFSSFNPMTFDISNDGISVNGHGVSLDATIFDPVKNEEVRMITAIDQMKDESGSLIASGGGVDIKNGFLSFRPNTEFYTYSAEGFDEFGPVGLSTQRHLKIFSETEYHWVKNGDSDPCVDSESNCISDYYVEVDHPDSEGSSVQRRISAHMRGGMAEVAVPEDYQLDQLYVGDTGGEDDQFTLIKGETQLIFEGDGYHPVSLVGDPKLLAGIDVDREYYSQIDKEIHHIKLALNEFNDDLINIEKCTDCSLVGSINLVTPQTDSFGASTSLRQSFDDEDFAYAVRSRVQGNHFNYKSGMCGGWVRRASDELGLDNYGDRVGYTAWEVKYNFRRNGYTVGELDPEGDEPQQGDFITAVFANSKQRFVKDEAGENTEELMKDSMGQNRQATHIGRIIEVDGRKYVMHQWNGGKGEITPYETWRGKNTYSNVQVFRVSKPGQEPRNERVQMADVRSTGAGTIFN
jgi:hypothetical protein